MVYASRTMVRVQFRVQGMEGRLAVDLAPGACALFGSDPRPERLPVGLVEGSPTVVRVPAKLVSANHALVFAHAAGAWVLDLESRNGTTVRHEPGAVTLEVAPRPTDRAQRPTFPEGPVFTHDGDFARAVCARVSRWLRDASVDADAALSATTDDAAGRGSFALVTGERLVVTPRAGTHDARLVDDLAAVARFVEQQNALRGEEGGHEPGFVLRSEPLRAAHHAVCEAARLGRGLLLLGPSGTGKERFARCYHQHSARSDGPFVAINCGAIPEALVENELFGSVAGAFHGAKGKPGLFEVADGGTFFLDEVAELPPALQVKLLRVLEGGTFRRLGDVRERRVDVQVVCATHRDLREAIDAGRFREDLWYRLARHEVTLPSLQGRVDDIEALLQAQRLDGARTAWDALTPAARDLVRAHPWPGNVRELLNFAGRLPDEPGRSVDAAMCQRLLGLRASAAPPAEPPSHAAAPTSAGDWRAIESRVWTAWRRAHQAPPADFHELMRFVDDYLKPAFVAWHGNVSADVSSLDEIAVNPVAKRLGVDWNTASKWLARYVKTYGRS